RLCRAMIILARLRSCVRLWPRFNTTGRSPGASMHIFWTPSSTNSCQWPLGVRMPTNRSPTRYSIASSAGTASTSSECTTRHHCIQFTRRSAQPWRRAIRRSASSQRRWRTACARSTRFSRYFPKSWTTGGVPSSRMPLRPFTRWSSRQCQRQQSSESSSWQSCSRLRRANTTKGSSSIRSQSSRREMRMLRSPLKSSLNQRTRAAHLSAMHAPSPSAASTRRRTPGPARRNRLDHASLRPLPSSDRTTVTAAATILRAATTAAAQTAAPAAAPST
ncbi:hypothetical protein GGF42_008740, partial [Coemansia sp. RSA 2424]